MDTVDELQRILVNVPVTAAKEYGVHTMPQCNVREFLMNLKELQRIMGNIPR